jgi:hypothetical protein
VHHSFSKLERIFTLMVKERKRIEIGKICFYNKFEHIWFKHAFGLEN